jgi:hypothetical protein
LLADDLAAHDVEAELYLVGGAVMCLVFVARASTKDVDAYCKPTRVVRDLRREWLSAPGSTSALISGLRSGLARATH